MQTGVENAVKLSPDRGQSKVNAMTGRPDSEQPPEVDGDLQGS